MKKKLLCGILLSLTFTCHAQLDLNKLDGTISTNEAKILRLVGENNQSQLLIDQSMDNHIKVVIRSENLYVASLCIYTSKNEILVLHASAALGDISYKSDPQQKWLTKEKFNWEMREQEMTPNVVEKRRAYLKNRGWVANTMSMGKEGEVEFILAKSMLDSGPTYLAVGLMTVTDPENIIGIPEDLSHSYSSHSLVSGSPAQSYSFEPMNWIKLP